MLKQKQKWAVFCFYKVVLKSLAAIKFYNADWFYPIIANSEEVRLGLNKAGGDAGFPSLPQHRWSCYKAIYVSLGKT